MLGRTMHFCLAIVAIILAQATAVHAQFSVSGIVTDPSVTPVADVEIFLYDDQGDPIGIPPTFTDGSGFYILTGLPSGTFGFGFEPPGTAGLLPYLDEAVLVTTNVTLNVTLPIGQVLSGFVRDTLGAPIPNIDLNVYDQATGDKFDTPGDNTDGTGYYEVLVPVGTFRLRWRAVSGEKLVPVEILNVVINGDTAIDVTMLAGYLVTGTVLNNLAQPVYNADLDFVDATTGLTIATPGDNTDLFGVYSAIIPAGLIDINVEPLAVDKLVTQDKLGVPVTKDTVINFTLQPGFYVSGIVSTSGAVGVPNVDIDVSYTTTGEKLITPGDKTDGSGFYEVVVPSGQLDFSYQPPVATSLVPVIETAYMITGDAVINVTVPNGVILSGTVRNNSGQPVISVDIDAEDAITGVHAELAGDHTDATGSFAVVVLPGTYHIDFEPLLSRRLAAKQVLNQSVITATDLQIVLDTGMLVAGTVRDSLNSVAPNVKVRALISVSGDTTFTPGNVTNSLGIYDIVVAPETYDMIYTTDSLLPIVDTLVLANVPIGRDITINATFPAGNVVSDSCCIAPIRGNVDSDLGDAVDISDLVYLVDFMFVGGPPPSCLDEGNLDGGGGIDISDLVYLVDYMFTGGPLPAPCPLL